MLLIDDYYKMTWVTFLEEKSEAFERFKVFKSMVENQVNAKIKCLRSNKGGEFTSNEFDYFCVKHGIIRHLSIPRNPQQKEAVERKNRTIIEMAITMTKDANLVNVY